MKIDFKRLFVFLYLLFIHAVSYCQQNWEIEYYNLANLNFASNHYKAANQFYNVQNYFSSLDNLKNENQFYSIETLLRRNVPGSDKMLNLYIIDNPTSYLSETAFFDAANFYFKNGKYSYALKWYNRVSEKDVSKHQKNMYNFNKGYSLFVSKRYNDARKYFQKVQNDQDYQENTNYYLGFIAYQLENFEEANENFDKLNRDNDKNITGYFRANMNFKLGRFEEAIRLAIESLDGSDEKEESELSKIIGESYFNLEDYRSALSYLPDYKGKNGKLNNTHYYQLGYSNYKLNNYSEAIINFNKIISGNDRVAQNAYYHLADSYLKMEDLTSSLNAFKKAAQMNFDLEIKEDAYLNYAKLSYGIGNSYQEPSFILNDFLKKYPKNKEANYIQKLILESYLKRKNYGSALKVLDKYPKSEFKEIRQKALFLKAVSLYNVGLYKESINYFEKGLENNYSPRNIVASKYWISRAFFEEGEYERSLKILLELKTDRKFISVLDKEIFIDYDIAYNYLKLSKYNLAVSAFNESLGSSFSELYRYDSYLRIADSYFVLKNYSSAIENYRRAIKLNKRPTYPYFQIALSYGLLDKPLEKINQLKSIIKSFPGSTVIDDCHFELATTFANSENYEKALKNYDYIIEKFPKSIFAPKAILNKALILYNEGDLINSENLLREYVKKFPTEITVAQALVTLKEIAIERNSVEEFSIWIKSSGLSSISELEIEKATIDAIDVLVNQKKEKQLKKALDDYILNYPNGLDIKRISYMLGEILYSNKKWDESILNFKKVISGTRNNYTEKSIVRICQSLIELDNNSEATIFLERLQGSAEENENLIYAASNLMKISYEDKNYNKAVIYGEKLISFKKINGRIKSDAYLIIARSFMNLGNKKKALDAYKKLENDANKEFVVEALYFKALDNFDKNDYLNSNLVIEKISNDFSGYKKWTGKSLLLMSKNFYQLGDAFQATFILESVIENFDQMPDIVEEAKKNLLQIKEIESKKNSSVEINN
ncbi:MAG: tetratricopeptide repeat protein [Flavobacteriales bacterium]|nr:MAG: tetratricopeptide repeat protein [Flavobacteriales bacterium]